ncbi:MAG TPA: protein-glutamate O-methyltransferase CheR [Thermoanaerobaculia bacterium]|nr:protein-glutamate O-methyltransferase CheR [Thermoanaerobaculia bacterium]
MNTSTPRPLTTTEFRLVRDFMHREAGISLSDQKRSLVMGRLAPRLRALSLSTYGEYLEQAIADRDEAVRMIDAICTNETQFFREPKQFTFLQQQILPAWIAQANEGRRRKHVRVWSAACSTGEEPYSIAMTLLAALPDWTIEILASDLSTKVLARAEEALWPVERAQQIPEHYRRTFMLRGVRSQEGKMTAKPELREVIRFQRINLNGERWPVGGRFDLIFCRNVLIYFDSAAKNRVVQRLLDLLDPAGYFFLGHSETLNMLERVRSVGPTVYQLRKPK